jgi:signal transduction histidine kinase
MLDALFSSDFIPHGHCFLWNPAILWTQVLSNGAIAVSYVAISGTLAYLVHHLRESIPYRGMYLAFGAFIVLCGVTHMTDVLVVWKPAYWLDSAIRVATAVVSAATAAMLPSLVPNAAALARATRAAHDRGMKLETAFRDLGSMYQRTKELDELKSQFFANVSHELRTPIALVLGPIQKLLADGRLDEAAQNELRIALRNARVLQKQVDDLLLAARLEAGLKLEYADVDLAPLIRDVGSNFESLATDRSLAHSVITPERLRAEVDADKVQRIVLNLLSNAFKFTPAGGRIRCELASESADDASASELTITVADSGPGIEPMHRQAVFERFRQLDGGPTRQKGGVGLGLAIVKELVDLHHGRVIVTQAPEGGAAFIVNLPTRAPAGVSVRAASTDTPAPDGDATRQTVEALIEPARINPIFQIKGLPIVLVVEDHQELNRFMCDALASEYDAVPAFDGRDGYARAVSLHPDLVITDLMMPGTGGETLIKQIRDDPSLDRVPVIVATAVADEAERVRLLREGAQDFLVKPFAVEELRARVRNLVALKRGQDELIDAKRATEAVNKELETFSYAVSHDLRAPLRAIGGFAEALLQDHAAQLDADARSYLALIGKGVEKMRELIEGLLQLSRVDRAQLTLERIDMTRLAREALSDLQWMHPERRVEVRVEEGLAADGDTRLIRQVIQNLLENAWKYTRDTVSARIEIGAAGVGPQRAFFVRDNGAGFDMKHVGGLFKPFTRLHREDEFPGIGIGLATVQRIVARHGGRIWAQALPGRGATFWFTLHDLANQRAA